MNAVKLNLKWSLGHFLSSRFAMPFAKRRGAVVVLVAVLMVALLAFVAFSVDLGYVAVARAQLQSAADAGALAGARGLTQCCPTMAISEAQRVAQLNSVYQDAVSVTPSQDIVLGMWDSNSLTFTAVSPAQQFDANAVQVTCNLTGARGNALSLFFGRVLGLNSQDVVATAIAQSTHIECGPFVGINFVTISGGSYTDSYDSSSAPYSAGSAGNKGTVCSNGTITLTGGLTVVHGDAHPGPGDSVSESGGSSVTGSQAPLILPLVEPAVDPGNAATVNDNASIPLSAQGKHPLVNGAFGLSGGDSVTLSPGTYYFSKLTLSGSSSVGITGKTLIYVTGKIDTSGGTLTNTTLIPSNLQLYGMGTTVVLSGGTQMYGVVYAPTANITRSGGNSDFFGSMVGLSLTLSGGGGLHADLAVTRVTGSSRKATLVQ